MNMDMFKVKWLLISGLLLICAWSLWAYQYFYIDVRPTFFTAVLIYFDIMLSSMFFLRVLLDRN